MEGEGRKDFQTSLKNPFLYRDFYGSITLLRSIWPFPLTLVLYLRRELYKQKNTENNIEGNIYILQETLNLIF